MAKKIKYTQLEAVPAKDTDVVHTTGDESIDDKKTFNDLTTLQKGFFQNNGFYYGDKSIRLYPLSYSYWGNRSGALIIDLGTGSNLYQGTVYFEILIWTGTNSRFPQKLQVFYYISSNAYSYAVLENNSTRLDRVTSVKSGQLPNGNDCLILNDVADTWAFPSIVVEKAMGGRLQNTSLQNDWNVSFETDLSSYNILYNFPLEVVTSPTASQISSWSNDYLPLSGGTMTGHIDTMDGFVLKSNSTNRLRFGPHSVLSSDGTGGVYIRPQGDGNGNNQTVFNNSGLVQMTYYSGTGTRFCMFNNSGQLIAVDLPAYNITTAQINNWEQAYADSHTHGNETVLNLISLSDYSHWNSTYAWMNNHGVRYPNWDEAYSWGNHATVGYATQTWVSSNFISKGSANDYVINDDGSIIHQGNLIWNRRYSIELDSSVHSIAPRGQLTVITIDDGDGAGTVIELPDEAYKNQEVIVINNMATDVVVAQETSSGGIALGYNEQLRVVFVYDDVTLNTYKDGVKFGTGKWITTGVKPKIGL